MKHAWYAVANNAPQPYSGLLVTGDTVDEVIEKLPGALRELREAFSIKTAQGKGDSDVA
jgi:hypothetical protein